MAYFGLQYRGDGAAPRCDDGARVDSRRVFAAESGPTHWDRAHYRDEAGYDNVVSVAYWDDSRASTHGSRPRATAGPANSQRAGLGTFIEVLRPSSSDYETLFSSLGRPEGVAALADSMSGEVHGARLLGRHARPHPAVADRARWRRAARPSLVRDGERLRVKPHDNSA